MKSQDKMKTGIKIRLISGFTTLLLIISIVSCLFFTLQSLSVGYVSLGGTSLFRVVTGSMEPAISIGSLLVSKKTDINTIDIDDIVCFRSKEQGIRGMIITHRVIDTYETPDGNLVLQTKGDANLTADIDYVSQDNLIGRVIWHTGDGSNMARIINFLTSDFGFIACIILPVILIAVWIFRDAIKNMKKAIADAESKLNSVNEEPNSLISKEEYKDLYNKIQEEVRKELEQNAEENVEQSQTDISEDINEIETAETPTDNLNS